MQSSRFSLSTRPIEKAIGQCELLIVIMGRNWLGPRVAEEPRINDPQDFVRIEIAAALSRNIPVIPVLLDGTMMPTEEELPESLRAMRKRSGIDVSNKSFRSDVDGLISAARRALGEAAIASKRVATARPWWRSSAVYSLVAC